MKNKILILFVFLSIAICQGPYRYGTTGANFLEIGMGSAGNSMGEAYVAVADDLSASYWNPAGLASINKNQVMFMQQPWIVGINTNFVSVAVPIPNVGTIALSSTNVDYGSMEVTTLEYQDGTGEKYSASDYAIGLSYARNLVPWFSFGATGKYISTQIWHSKASAFAVDLGVVVTTGFFTFSKKKEDGLKIGMSISNYGTRLKYDGIDLVNYIDIDPDEGGNFKWVPANFRMDSWTLPIIFRIGIAGHPISTDIHKLTFAIDALHPNNNNESVNVGSQYQLNIPGYGSFFLRAGYKGLFMNDSQYGLAIGGGVLINLFGNRAISFDYAYKDIGILGNTHSYTIGLVL